MAQSGYSAFYQQPAYPYSPQIPQYQQEQSVEPRAQPQYSPQYQHPPYPQTAPTPSQLYGYGVPQMQRPPSRTNPSPMPTNPVGSVSQQQYGQFARPPPSPQPYLPQSPSNPYPSPVSPQTSQASTPQTGRRPLPQPRGLPSVPHTAGFQAPAPQQPPSPQPGYATHRPTQSVPSVFPNYPLPSSNGYVPPSSQEPSPTSSAFSTTSTSPPRPLPLPRSTGNTDLSSAQQNQSRSHSPPKRALPAPQPSPTHDAPPIRSPEPVSASGQRFVPLWKRALPQPGAPSGSGRVLPAPAEARQPSQLERRSTVSTSRPLPPSPGDSNQSAVGQPRDPLTRIGTLPPHLQLGNLPPSPQSPADGPSGLPPSVSQSGAVPDTSSSPPSSRFALRERSRTLPLPAAAPTYPLPPKPANGPASPRQVFDRSLSQSPHSSDDEELTNALLERNPRSPSPQYGIRDLPRNNPQAQSRPAGSFGSANEATPRARRELPSPVSTSHSQSSSSDNESSLAFRMASVSLQSNAPAQSSQPSHQFRQGHGSSNSISSGNASRPMPQPPSKFAQPEQERQPQQQRTAWPSALPPLPRAPASPQPSPQSASTQPQTRSRPLPTRSNTAGGSVPPFAQPRSPRKVDLDLSLDDAPPPSLRRSPAPPASHTPSNSGVQLPRMDGRARTAPANPQLQRMPSESGASIFSLSSFPPPPTHEPPSPTKAAFKPPSPTKSGFGPSLPTKSGFGSSSPMRSGFGASSPTKPSFGGPSSPQKSAFNPPSPPKPTFRPPSPAKQDIRAPSPTKPHFAVRAPSPTKYNPPSFVSPERTHSAPRAPKISFPANPDGDSDEDDGNSGPVINISGPGDSRSGGAPSIPRIAFGDDDSDNGIPSINIGGVDDQPPIPQILLPGQPSSPSRERRDRPQTRKIQETLANPRLEAAKRSGLVCGGCGGPIIGRIVSAMDMRWHPGCFRCCVCDELLENLSSYAHEGRPYCHLDYHEKFAPRCYHCQTAIVDERFITLDDTELGKRTYHEQHFFCAECGDPFLPPAAPGAPSRTFAGDGEFAVNADDDVGFTVYRGHPYCEACHVRLRMPKCKKCKRSIRDGMQAVEALGGKWCWECFTCASCDKPFDNPAFFQRDGKPFCERCFSIMIRNEL
ncbi:hypothetical protein BD413DRAFT_616562 [Trametes elegans]|nr:hypothetical protein BD413DRAFT_616562 [Trametes elegans]